MEILICLLCWLALDMLISNFQGLFLTHIFLIFLAKKILGKKSCLVEVHEWKYEKKSIEAEFEASHSYIKEHTSIIRTCSKCNKTQYTLSAFHLMTGVKWKPGKGPEKIVFRRI